jgi:CRISPR/Cas system CSM-associated protein Csm2 small subunit
MILTCGGKFLSEDDLFLNKDPLQDTLRYSKTLDLALSRRGYFGDDDDTYRTPKKWKQASTHDPKLGDAKLQWDLPDTERDRLFDSINDSIRNFIQSVYNEPKERTQLPQQLREGLDSLLRRITKGEIIVTSCDKNLGFVVLSSKTYIEAVMVHLQDNTTYRLIGTDSKTIRDGFKSKYTKNLRKLLEDHKGFIDWKTMRQLVEATEEAAKSTQYFKIIVKIHKMKPDLEKIVGRPITPARGFYTSILSRYVSDLCKLKDLPWEQVSQQHLLHSL